MRAAHPRTKVGPNAAVPFGNAIDGQPIGSQKRPACIQVPGIIEHQGINCDFHPRSQIGPRGTVPFGDKIGSDDAGIGKYAASVNIPQTIAGQGKDRGVA